MNTKLIGSILMILGTSIGAGMLALPIVTAQEHILMFLLVLFSCWALSTLGALALMKLSLAHAPGCNILSMAESTLGLPGKLLSGFVYAALMYSLLCAYLAGTGEIFSNLSQSAGVPLSQFSCIILASICYILILSNGISVIDKCNRLLMSAKTLCFLMLIFLLFPHIDYQLLHTGQYQLASTTLAVVITSFGYSVIVPSVTDYLDRDAKKIRIAILIGSAIPFFIYLIWVVLISGIIPRTGHNGLIAIAADDHTNNALLSALTSLSHVNHIGPIASIFMTIAVATSLLGVALALSDFIADGLQKKKQGIYAIWIYTLTFLPPLLILNIMPSLFIVALSYAGSFCFILLVLLPLTMLMALRRQEIQRG